MTKKSASKYIILVAMLFLMPVAFILTFNSMKHHFESLPFYGEYDLVANAQGSLDTTWKAIPTIVLQDETGSSFSSEELKGDVWLVAFYSISSPQITKITERLLSVNFKYRNEEDIKIVAISPNPNFDTPERRLKYLKEIQSVDGKWKFLTGTKDEVNELANEVFNISDPGESAVVWLVDDKGYLRGKFNANVEKEINRAIESIAMMKKEIDLRTYEREKMDQ